MNEPEQVGGTAKDTDRGPTAEQGSVLSAPEPWVFVSAGAGTGKTFLLVERYVQAVEEGIEPADIPTVTFTRKAAGEIRERVRAELNRRGHGARAADLSDAPITTIHGLCSRILRRFPVKAGVDPFYSVMAEEETAILRSRVFEQVWAEKADEAPDTELELMSRHGRRQLEQVVLGLFGGLRGVGQEELLLDRPKAPDVRAGRRDLEASVCACRDGIPPDSRKKKGAQNNLEKLAGCEEWIREAEGSWEDLLKPSSFMPSLNCDKGSKPFFSRLKQDLAEFQELLETVYMLEVLDLMEDLLGRFDRSYRTAKAARGVLDFEDLELRTVSLLKEGVRPFSEGSLLIVDEFQDTNPSQCAILDNLGVGSTVTVGDEFQSIYGFRGADVRVFRERRQGVGTASPGPGEQGFYQLSVNFRSTPPVLDAINAVFSDRRFFGPEFPRLRPEGDGEDAEDRGSPAVEVLTGVVGDDEKKDVVAGKEAAAVAECIDRLIADGYEPGDVAVLLRTLTRVTAFEEALSARGLPVHVVRGRGYYSRREFGDVVALLRLLVDRRDDVSLITVLRSPVAGLSDDTLYLLRRYADEGTTGAGKPSLWEGVRKAVRSAGAAEPAAAPDPDEAARLGVFWERFTELERRVGRAGLAALAEEAVEAFDYDLHVLAGREGALRAANLQKLTRLAEEYEAVEGPDLSGFVRYLEEREEVAGHEGNAPLVGEEENVVRIMTVHQAKGLEFPVVVVPDLGSKQGNRRKPAVLVDRDGRWALRLNTPSGSAVGSGDGALTLGPYEEMQQERARREEEETLRIFYVAATRAEEKLILSGWADGTSPDSLVEAVLCSLGVDHVLPPGMSDSPRDDLSVAVRGVDAPVVTGAPEAAERRETASPFTAPGPVQEPAGRGPWRLSFSDIALYHRCPRRFRLERILELPPPGEAAPLDDYDHKYADAVADEGGDGGSALDVGLVVHRVLERLPPGVLGGPEPPEDSFLYSTVDSAQNELQVSLPGPARERARLLSAGFWRSPVGEWFRKDTGGVTEREAAFAFSWGDVLYTGVMDVCVPGADPWKIADFKTNSVGGRGVREVAEAYDLQVKLYGLAALRAGAGGAEVVLVFLERPEAPVRTTFTAGDEGDLALEVERAAGGITKGIFPPRPGACTGCPGAQVLGCAEGQSGWTASG